MSNKKALLLDQLAACHYDRSWFIPLQEIISDLSATQAAWQNESNQSIWKMTNHLIFWNETWLKRFIEEKVAMDMNIDNEDTFYVDPLRISDKDWNETVHRLEASFRNWRNAIEECDEGKLDREIPSYFHAPWWGVVSNLCIHNAYHIGQIMLLKKQMPREIR